MDLRERTSTNQVRHPWETVRSAFFNNKICKLTNSQPVQVLDIGSGDCWFSEQLLSKLPAGSHITCCDSNFTDQDINTHLISGIKKVRELPKQQYDIVIMLDVLEHIENDSSFLQTEVTTRLKPDGHLVVSVPAHPSLFTSHDEFLGHYRRYTKHQLLEVVGASFTVNQHGYLFISLALVRLLQRFIATKRSTNDSGVGAWKAGQTITKLVNCALYADSFLSKFLQVFRIRIPGLTVWTICVSKNAHPLQ